jgi:uncharacterized glyoxalase superfamily protein PhnB
MTDTKIIAGAPILLVKNVVDAANYYRDKVGFSYDQLWGDPPGFCIVRRDGCSLMLSQVQDATHVVPHYKNVEGMWNAYFWTSDVAALYEELKERGAIIDYELCDQPYGCREFGIQDSDGYDIAFGQDMAL